MLAYIEFIERVDELGEIDHGRAVLVDLHRIMYSSGLGLSTQDM